MKVMNDKSNKMFAIVREELNNLDILGVVKDNKKLVDEYDLENQMILARLKEDMDYIGLAKIIKEIFEINLAEKFNEEIVFNTAKNILEKIKKL